MAGRGGRDLFGDVPADAAKMATAVFNRIIWTDGVALLEAAGVKPENARSLLGKKQSELGRPALVRGIVSAYVGDGTRPVGDPLRYIAALRPPPPVNADGPDVFEGRGEDDDVNEPFWESDEEGPR